MKLFLRVQAPFGVFRPLAAGWYRTTAAMVTPSAAYGLLLNFAKIESRIIETNDEHDGSTPASLTRSDLPRVKIALGIPNESAQPTKQTVMQQIHNYPIGKDAGVPAEWTKGNKNNIAPVKREFLSDIDFVVGLDADNDFCERVRNGIGGTLNEGRYGLPFLGDNSFLLDSVSVLPESMACHWYERVTGSSGKTKRVNEATRLTIEIDRGGFSGTRSEIFLPTESASAVPSEMAWTQVGSSRGETQNV